MHRDCEQDEPLLAGEVDSGASTPSVST